MNKISTFIICLCMSTMAITQNITDVARWSYLDPIGTARTLGVGSAFGAMGGDYSVIHINPAGLGDYRISEFVISPSIKAQKSTGYFVANPTNTTTISKTGLGLDNISFVIASQPKSKWTSSNFAMGFSRQADIGRTFTIEGETKGTITTYFAEKANTFAPDDLDDFIEYPAYNTGAIYDNDKDKFYETDFASPDTKVNKSQNVTQKGGINEITLAWAGEYENKLNVGFSVGMPIFSFDENKEYIEDDVNGTLPVFTRLSYQEALNTTGVGFILRGGVIYKISNRIRIGGAFHSPTWAKFTDNYSTGMTYSYNDGNPNSYDYNSPDGSFEYNITTPWRVVGSLGTTYKVGDLKGFVNADIEFIDYTNASYNGTAYSDSPEERRQTNDVNRDVQAKLGAATNFRIGTELAYNELRLRAGYGLERTPFIADDFYNKKVSFGIGYRQDKFFMDLGIRLTSLDEGYNAYTVLDSSLDPLANIESTRTRANFTFGFKF